MILHQVFGILHAKSESLNTIACKLGKESHVVDLHNLSDLNSTCLFIY